VKVLSKMLKKGRVGQTIIWFVVAAILCFELLAVVSQLIISLKKLLWGVFCLFDVCFCCL